MKDDLRKELRKLPSVDRLLKQERVVDMIAQHGRPLTLAAMQDVLSEARQAILEGQNCPTAAQLAEQSRMRLEELLRPSLYPVINATGVIIHTNLGRAPLSLAAQQAMQATSQYCNLEYDVDAGERGSRYVHAEELLCRLTGAEAALVVNNDAAAVLLALTALARGREVIISRGQLVEIGGGFRIPEVMSQSGAQLVEVGTTNRTYLSDYEAAITPQTAMLLSVHTSNFRVVGFAHETPLAELVALARSHALTVVDDLGSGALLDTASFGLTHERTVQESLAAGAELTCFSGDKLLGGPQAGIILGTSQHISKLKRHPLTRALRVGKSVLSGLQATLQHYLSDEATQTIPVWQMMATDLEQLKARAATLTARLRAAGVDAGIADGFSAVGGGTLPGETLPTCLVTIHGVPPQTLAPKLRHASPPVMGRIENEAFVLDLRTVLPGQEGDLLRALLAAF